MKPEYIGIDQNGGIYRHLQFPRRDLLRRLGRKHAEKMYVDRGKKTYHVGYVIAGLWINLYAKVEKETDFVSP